MWAELEGLIASGPRLGRQFSYRLLDERAPAGEPFDRDAALAELAGRYIASHGPATTADLANWSGLTLTDARRGIAAAQPALLHEEVDGQTLWFADAPLPPRPPSPTAYLLSIYDESTIGYKDRSAIVSADDGARLGTMGNALQNVIVIDGRIVGTWRRTLGKDTLGVELDPFRGLSEREPVSYTHLDVYKRQVSSIQWVSGSVGQWVSGSVGQWVSGSVGRGVRI